MKKDLACSFMPAEWSLHTLGDLFDERVERGHVSLPLLSITREFGVIPRDDENLKTAASEDKSAYLRICPGDIGYNTMRMWQGISALSKLEGIVSPAYTVCTPRTGVHGPFMAALFKLPEMVNLFYRYSQGLTSDTWNLKYPHFAEIRVRVPSESEQIRIANVIEMAESEVRLSKTQVELSMSRKAGLLQRLLKGESR
jgi:type I restriction enzyme, S subunit